jgi:hypothetical protein
MVVTKLVLDCSDVSSDEVCSADDEGSEVALVGSGFVVVSSPKEEDEEGGEEEEDEVSSGCCDVVVAGGG